MTGSERIDKVTAQIEEEIRKSKSPAKIAENVAQSIGISTRDLSTIFMFLTGQTLFNYIKERKMMAAYESILASRKYDAQTAVSLSGLGDQSAFNKNFRRQFGYTPKIAFKKKDFSILKPRITWAQMGNTEIVVHGSPKKNTLKNERVFGVERSKYNELKEVVELQDAYKFDEAQSEIAYSIYQMYDIPMKDAFRFVSEFPYNENPIELGENKLRDELRSSEDEEMNILNWEAYLENIKKCAEDPEIRYIYFEGDMDSIFTVFEVLEKLHNAGETDVTQIDIDVINICAYEEIDVGYCKKAVKYYKEHANKDYGEDAFQEYIEYILENQPIEIAFSNIIEIEDDFENECPYLTMEDFYAYLNKDDPDDPFEKWIEQETDYSDRYRIDINDDD